MKKFWKILGDVLGGTFAGFLFGLFSFILGLIIFPNVHTKTLHQRLEVMGYYDLISFIIMAILASLTNYKLFKVKPLWLAILVSIAGMVIFLLL